MDKMNSPGKEPPICPGCNVRHATKSRLPNSKSENEAPYEDLPWGLCVICDDDAFGGATSLCEELAREVIILRARVLELERGLSKAETA